VKLQIQVQGKTMAGLLAYGERIARDFYGDVPFRLVESSPAAPTETLHAFGAARARPLDYDAILVYEEVI
jgi:hypothetical protein